MLLFIIVTRCSDRRLKAIELSGVERSEYTGRSRCGGATEVEWVYRGVLVA